jgi:hypothetical protein
MSPDYSDTSQANQHYDAARVTDTQPVTEPRLPAWTPGEWYVSDAVKRVEHGTGKYVIAVFSRQANDDRLLVGYTTHDDDCDAGSAAIDATLIALAPEMAEAILADHAASTEFCQHSNHPDDDNYPCDCAAREERAVRLLNECAAKLLAIGAPDA